MIIRINEINRHEFSVLFNLSISNNHEIISLPMNSRFYFMVLIFLLLFCYGHYNKYIAMSSKMFRHQHVSLYLMAII